MAAILLLAMGVPEGSNRGAGSVTTGLAVVDGRWRLARTNDSPHGRFTLLFRRNNNDWRIIHDTTTSATP